MFAKIILPFLSVTASGATLQHKQQQQQERECIEEVDRPANERSSRGVEGGVYQTGQTEEHPQVRKSYYQTGQTYPQVRQSIVPEGPSRRTELVPDRPDIPSD